MGTDEDADVREPADTSSDIADLPEIPRPGLRMRLHRRYRGYMAEVGVRELKNALSRYLKRVRAGETIVVTDRGEPIAWIIPTATPERIARLMADGRVTWSGKRFEPPDALIRPRTGPPFSDYIGEDRG